jgi:1-acyl-sn-glycerol-3-phosphate acyltransferase
MAMGKNLFYRWVRSTSRLLAVLVFRFRMDGRHFIPSEGPGIILSTHQSMLDPVLVGILFNQRLSYIARKTLFHNPLFAFLIRVLDAIEIDREKGGLSGLREMLARLQTGKMVLIFPEGTRSKDGQIGDLKLGFSPIARRSKVPLIPIAISGAFSVLQRGSILPQLQPIAVVVGQPILAEEYLALNEGALKSLIAERLDHCKRQADQLRHCSIR